MTICGAGQKSVKCDHKRNVGDGVVKCAISADKDKCSFAISEEEFKAKIDKASKKEVT